MSQELRCRAAEVVDSEEIAELLRRSIIELCVADHGNREEPLRAWLENKTAANVTKWICNPANIMIAVVAGKQIAGVGCLRTDGHITLNYVAPPHRFSGVSKTILAALEDRGRGLKLTSLKLESTKTAHVFYKRRGFADAGPKELKHGLPTYPMVKQLR